MATDSPTSYRLLTDAQLKSIDRRKTSLVIIPVLVSTAFNIGVMVLLTSRQAHGVHTALSAWVFIGILFLMIGSLFVPMFIFGRKAELIVLPCPACGEDLSKSVLRVRQTRCCYKCDARVLEGGRSHRAKVYDRFCSYRLTRLLRRCLWLIPAMCVMVLVQSSYAPQMAARAQRDMVVWTILGTIGCTWMYVRTRDRRCMLPMIGVAVAWIALYVSKQQGLLLTSL